MSYLGLATNDYGTPVSVHKCEWCLDVFTVCPAKPPRFVGDDEWDGCLAETCTSYDVSRDIDLVWDALQDFIEVGE